MINYLRESGQNWAYDSEKVAAGVGWILVEE